MTLSRESSDSTHDEEGAYPDANGRVHNRRNGRAFVCSLFVMLGVVWFLNNLRARSAPPDPDIGKTDTLR
ncbi:hypothetical protein BDM02DRAFT_3108403 [Thelephora ganbajun]|uniref:Uncharacterized protein n=1 Tax=Thelephora ganbajun TaxID=370292 RepID=A0ACB6ZU77_THEGA|nr:hypothetical protein BDM02DRAFT_3108403 [Thelephora ganbajun]